MPTLNDALVIVPVKNGQSGSVCNTNIVDLHVLSNEPQRNRLRHGPRDCWALAKWIVRPIKLQMGEPICTCHFL